MSSKTRSSTGDVSADNCESSGKRASWESRRQYLNEKYALELDNAHSLSPEELRRLRRRISNRESARRLRKQRSEKLGELQQQQGTLHEESIEINKQLLVNKELLQRLQAENAALRIRLGEAELLVPPPPLGTPAATTDAKDSASVAKEASLSASERTVATAAISIKRPLTDTLRIDEAAEPPTQRCARLSNTDASTSVQKHAPHTVSAQRCTGAGSESAGHADPMDDSSAKAADVSRSIQETLAKAGFDLNVPAEKYLPRTTIEMPGAYPKPSAASASHEASTALALNIPCLQLSAHSLHTSDCHATANQFRVRPMCKPWKRLEH